MDEKKESRMAEKEVAEEQEARVAAPSPETGGGGSWGGWGFSPLSVLSDLQKAAAVAAEEISRNVFWECFSFTL